MHAGNGDRSDEQGLSHLLRRRSAARIKTGLERTVTIGNRSCETTEDQSMSEKSHSSTETGNGGAPMDRRKAIGVLAGGVAATAGLAAGSASSHGAEAHGILDGQVALVTGAGRGIGRAIAVAYARAGANVALLDIDDPERYRKVLGYSLASAADLAETEAQVKAAGREALLLRADVSDDARMAAAVAATLKHFGRIDIFVANAGVGGSAPVQQLSAELWSTIIGINLTGVANGLRAVLPSMVARGSGRVITIASVLGRRGQEGVGSYCASKWGVIGLTKATALDVGKSGVTVNAIAPSGVRTGIWGAMADSPEAMAALDAGLRQRHALDVGLMAPEDIAEAALYLASPGARLVSGMVLDVAAGANARYTG